MPGEGRKATLIGMGKATGAGREALAGWQVVLCRPVGQNRTSATLLRRLGAEPVLLPALRIAPAADVDAARNALRAALACSHLIFTSPAAVREAVRLDPSMAQAGATAIAVGSGTRSALRRAGWTGAILMPTRPDSEGLLGMDALYSSRARTGIGLVTAPGGRGLIEPALLARGIGVMRADVYRRETVAPRPSALAALDRRGPLALLASSEQAARQLVRTLPAPALDRLQRSPCVASSARLGAILGELGFEQRLLAAGPRPAQLVEALRGFAAAAPSCSIVP